MVMEEWMWGVFVGLGFSSDQTSLMGVTVVSPAQHSTDNTVSVRCVLDPVILWLLASCTRVLPNY